MRALCWHGKGDIRCDTVPDPTIEDSRDVIIKVSSCAICDSDLECAPGGGQNGRFEVTPSAGLLENRSRDEAPITQRRIQTAGCWGVYLAQPIQRAITTACGTEPLLYPSGFGSLPDYVFTEILGIPTFVVNYANADAANHAPDENMTLECFHNGIRCGAAILHELGLHALS